ncbi:SAVED domain-containing protein [Azotobacter sp. CWF10]
MNAKAFGLEDSPKLSLVSTAVVMDIASLNTAVSEAKVALVEFRARHQLQRVHLFIKAPSMFAMALGHRLNGVGRIQLYDWDQGSTSQLFSSSEKCWSGGMFSALAM